MTTFNKASYGSFSIDRVYPASVKQVFETWSDIGLKAKWFTGPPDAWTLTERSLEFHVGGMETLKGRMHGSDGMTTSFTARYHEIIPLRRLVYVYDMHLNERHHSVSLATVEFDDNADGTHLSFSEYVVFVDGTEGNAGRESRKGGTAAHFDRLQQVLTQTIRT